MLVISKILPLALIAILSAIIALVGNYYINHRLARRRLAVDELKTSLFEYLKLLAEYWIPNKNTKNSHREVIEAHILAMGSVISLRCLEIKELSKKLENWYVVSKHARLDLLESATGGCFQQSNWNPNPQRFQNATKIVTRILIDLNKAC